MPAARTSYHHGDLRTALVAAGLAMARERGAAAVVLREATRRTGVTGRAAYRHFADRDALVRAVAQAALAQMALAIEAAQAGTVDPLTLLRGVGEGYVRFALDEPGWFDVAFFAMADMANTVSPAATGRTGRSPYQQLEDALDALVRAGLLDRQRAPGAAITCWSGVHGFATLVTRGPLRELPREAADALARDLVDDLVHGVCGGGPAGPGG